MNIIKKYWDSVYIYVLILVPGFCMCAGTYWTSCKLLGGYSHVSWTQMILFDCSQLIYLAISLFYLFKNKKDSSYIPNHLGQIKGFVVTILFIQYNAIMYLFAAEHVAECTFLFFLILTFLIDSKLMALNIPLYGVALTVAHIIKTESFLPVGEADLYEVIAYRILIFGLTASCNLLVVFFVENVLIHAREKDEENVYLMEKQLRYYKDVELLDTELRKFRHDIKNHFACMEFLVNNGKKEELQEYFSDLNKDFSFNKSMYYSGNDVVDAILHYEIPHYCNEDVNVNIYGSLPNIETVSAMDLCTIFSNMLSNAIKSANACVGTLKSQLTIHFSAGNKYFSISMSNSVMKEEYIKSRKYKDKNHGFGTKKIKEVLGKYSGRYETSIEDNVINITVYLPI